MSVIVTNARGQIKADKTDAFLQDIRRAQRATLSIMARLNQCANVTQYHANKDNVENALYVVMSLLSIDSFLEKMVQDVVRQQ